MNVGGGTVCVCECGWGDCMCVNVGRWGLYVCVCVGGGTMCVRGRGDRMCEQLGDSRSVWGGGGGRYVGEIWGAEEMWKGYIFKDL